MCGDEGGLRKVLFKSFLKEVTFQLIPEDVSHVKDVIRVRDRRMELARSKEEHPLKL